LSDTLANGSRRLASLLRLYRTMQLIRTFEERALGLQSAGELYGVVHPCTGHEAIAAGVVSALGPGDVVASYYRSHGHALARGVDPGRMMAELYGKRTGLCRGWGGSIHMSDVENGFVGGNAIVGANVPFAAGFADAAQLRGDGGVVATFFGDGATAVGVVHETLNYASAARLPIVFVCENNLYQDQVPSELVLPSLDLIRIGRGHAMRSVSVDGNDAVAVRHAAARAVARARRGGGPTFLEARTFLRDFHSQIGERPPPPYRPTELVDCWRGRDPLERTRAAVLAAGGSATDLDDIDADVRTEVELAVDFARSSPVADGSLAAGGLGSR
jgi:TPP-dependent pyruvate/acetoin dehydrogenase alpha subunit